MTLDAALIAAMLAAVAGGFVRGFTGVGGALIFVPVASAVIGPQLAAPVFLIIDYTLTLPMVARSLRIARRATVLPAAIAAMITVPLGAWLLAIGDRVALRWTICLLVIALLALMMSGWRYRGAPSTATSLGVGGVAGLFGGIGQVFGPPIIALWMSGSDPVATIRANLLCFFGIVGVASFAAYFWYGFYSADVLPWLMVMVPLYAGSLFAGGWTFKHTGGANFRPITYALIAFAALSSMPAFDGVLR